MKQITKNVIGVCILLVLLCLHSCSLDGNETIAIENVAVNQAKLLEKIDCIVPINDGIGKWDVAYITHDGYFCYSEYAMSRTEKTNYEDNRYSALSFLTADETDIVGILIDRKNHLPLQMVTSKGTILFSYPSDNLLELLYSDNKKSEIQFLDSVHYAYSDIVTISKKYTDDDFKTTISNTAYLMSINNGKKSEIVSESAQSAYMLCQSFGEKFGKTCKMDYSSDSDMVSELRTNNNGDYFFASNQEDWFINTVAEDEKSVLSLWTGKASFKVGGSSCTLSATIWCSSEDYNEYGTYGILCDTNPDNLYIGKAEYQDDGYQGLDDVSFSVDFRGFKPNTTYYYRAFYAFDSDDHGHIVPREGSASDPVIYDSTIKSFTTGDNSLSVDVTMCIDITGSMSDIINTVKDNALSFYDLFNASCIRNGIELNALNAQIVAFRDKNADEEWLSVAGPFSLPNEQESFEKEMSRFYADGGGDGPESGLEALHQAFTGTKWGIDDGFHRQVVILWTDASYLVAPSYTSMSIDQLYDEWNAMPSGRRLILFAPKGTFSDIDYDGDWSILDDWKNVIHETDLVSGFNDFEYILESIIGELTGKSKAIPLRTKPSNPFSFFRPNYFQTDLK